MTFTTEFRAREKLERGVHWIAAHSAIPGAHRLHPGHFGGELLQTGILLTMFLAQLAYVVSNNDFRTGWFLLSSTARRFFRSRSAHLGSAGA